MEMIEELLRMSFGKRGVAVIFRYRKSREAFSLFFASCGAGKWGQRSKWQAYGSSFRVPVYDHFLSVIFSLISRVSGSSSSSEEKRK
mgnify:CR=1 FL=1